MDSYHFKELSPSELEKTVRSLLGTKLISSKLLDGGLFNTSYLIDTEDCGKAVLRACPADRRRLLPYELHLMEAEAEVYRLCSEAGVPAPDVMALDTDRERQVMIVRYIPGVSMTGLKLKPEERERILSDAGMALRRMNAIRGARFGRIWDVMAGGGHDSWSAALMQELVEWESVCAPCGQFSKEEHAKFRHYFERASAALDGVAEPRLVHGDLWEGNVLVSEGQDKSRSFAALIDADRAIWGDPDQDIAVAGWENERSFTDAWRPEGVCENLPARVRRTVYRLLIYMQLTFIYDVQFGWENDWKRCRERSLRILREAPEPD